MSFTEIKALGQIRIADFDQAASFDAQVQNVRLTNNDYTLPLVAQILEGSFQNTTAYKANIKLASYKYSSPGIPVFQESLQEFEQGVANLEITSQNLIEAQQLVILLTGLHERAVDLVKEEKANAAKLWVLRDPKAIQRSGHDRAGIAEFGKRGAEKLKVKIEQYMREQKALEQARQEQAERDRVAREKAEREAQEAKALEQKSSTSQLLSSARLHLVTPAKEIEEVVTDYGVQIRALASASAQLEIHLDPLSSSTSAQLLQVVSSTRSAVNSVDVSCEALLSRLDICEIALKERLEEVKRQDEEKRNQEREKVEAEKRAAALKEAEEKQKAEQAAEASSGWGGTLGWVVSRPFAWSYQIVQAAGETIANVAAVAIGVSYGESSSYLDEEQAESSQKSEQVTAEPVSPATPEIQKIEADLAQLRSLQAEINQSKKQAKEIGEKTTQLASTANEKAQRENIVALSSKVTNYLEKNKTIKQRISSFFTRIAQSISKRVTEKFKRRPKDQVTAVASKKRGFSLFRRKQICVSEVSKSEPQHKSIKAKK